MELSADDAIRAGKAYLRLDAHVRRKRYRGYDPYDVLTSPLNLQKWGKWPPILAIQLFKRNPFNLRKLLGVQPQVNAKALALFLESYSLRPINEEHRASCERILEQLLEMRNAQVQGYGWGYPFPWASPEKYLPLNAPTAVVTGFVARALYTYYRRYGDARIPQVLQQIALFISTELHHSEVKGGLAISYSTVQPDFCYNASLLAAEALSYAAATGGHTAYRHSALQALSAVIQRQKPDGSWHYSEHLLSGRERIQIDFHQGFVLDSIMAIAQALNCRSAEVETALQEGFEFYRDWQFHPEGRALWRLPHHYPADIHHQAQGIISACRYARFSGSRRATELATRVMRYTLEHFQAPSGYFYYRKHRRFTDRSNYMRWGNAWMHLALSTYQHGTEA